MRGHAGYNPGNDIVCAALSNTIYMLVNYIQERCPKALISFRGIPGDFDIVVSPSAGGSAEMETVLRMFKLGIRQITDNYPDNVRLEDDNDTI